MEKELKSCSGILLRADLTGHGHPTLFGRNRLIGWIGYALLGHYNILELWSEFGLIMAFRIATISSEGFTDEIQEGVESGMIPGAELSTLVI